MDIYEKLYNEAIERAKKHCADYVVETIFPELAEPKDEEIRKEIISIVKSYRESCITEGNHRFDNCIAWLEKQKTSEEALQYLRENHSSSEMSDFQAAMNIAVAKAYDKGYNDGLEKQGEQKPVVIIPKFRIGDNIKTTNEESLTITKIDEKGYWSEDLFICGFDEECIWDLVEQKPTEWSKEDERIYQSIMDDTVQENQLDGKQTDWLRDIKYRYFPQSKQEWSEEDEIALGDALWCCKQAASIAKDENDMGNIWYAETWLKSIKERVQPQPKQEWNEKDNQYLCGLIGLIEQSKAELPITLKGKAADNCIDWLKSLKDRYTWKPSDEQMEALKSVQEGVFRLNILESLYNDLQKLKGE